MIAVYDRREKEKIAAKGEKSRRPVAQKDLG